MHILLGFLTLLGVAAYWYFRMRDVGQAAGEIVDAAGRVRGAYKRKQFRKKVESSPIAAVEDPVAATTAMLVALASMDGRISPEAEAAIKEEMRSIMKVGDPTEAFTFAQWVADHVIDPNDLSLKFSKLWLSKLTPAERSDVYAMAMRIVALDGPPTDLQAESLKRLKDRLQLGHG
jgi:uncharacterized tellurite resistance protein B-like protein